MVERGTRGLTLMLGALVALALAAMVSGWLRTGRLDQFSTVFIAGMLFAFTMVLGLLRLLMPDRRPLTFFAGFFLLIFLPFLAVHFWVGPGAWSSGKTATAEAPAASAISGPDIIASRPMAAGKSVASSWFEAWSDGTSQIRNVHDDAAGAEAGLQAIVADQRGEPA